MDTSHLKRRGQTWYARLVVPPSLRPVIGKSDIVRSLKTRDVREAVRRKHRALAEMQEFLSQAAVRETLPKESAEFVLATARGLLGEIKRGESTQEQAEAALGVAVDQHLSIHAKRNGVDPETGHPLVDEKHERILRLAHRVLDSGDVALLSDSIKTYLDEIASRVRNATHRQKKRHLEAFAAWLGDCDVRTITKRIAGRYVTEKVLKAGHSPKTAKDCVANLVAFFSWLEVRGETEYNPFRGISGSIRTTTRGTKPSRRPWTNDELFDLLSKIPPSDPLWSMSAIAAYTGMRIEEIASLRVDDVQDDTLTVTEGKSRAAVRRVPIHAAIKPLVHRLVSQSTDGFLIGGLLPGGDDGRRSHYASKRFGGLCDRLGIKDTALTFHTLRNSFTQRCETGGVPESTAKLLVGHARDSLTYGLYSPGPEFDKLKAAMRQVSYGEVDSLVQRLSKTVEITKQSRPRRKPANRQ